MNNTAPIQSRAELQLVKYVFAFYALCFVMPLVTIILALGMYIWGEDMIDVYMAIGISTLISIIILVWLWRRIRFLRKGLKMCYPSQEV